MKPKAEIVRALVVSTENLSQKTFRQLATQEIKRGQPDDIPGVVSVLQGPGRGILIRHLDHAHDDDWPDDLADLARLASVLRCEWISIDPDGPIHPNLKTYPWN